MNGKQQLILVAGLALVAFRFWNSGDLGLVGTLLTAPSSGGTPKPGGFLGKVKVPAGSRVGMGLHTGYIPPGG